MSPTTWQRVKVLYSSACELPESERVLFVQSRGEEDPRAVAETLKLLRANEKPARTLAPIQAIGSLTQNHRLHPGQVLADRYQVRRFLASGGFGEVYEAEDRERAERVALKIFRSEFTSSEHVAWLRREVELARRVRHPNVCRVFDLVTDGGFVFLTMEFLEGETLASYLRREGALPERRALPLVRQMVAALAAAHDEGVVHRDFKPGNVMIVPRPDGPPRAVITDFGMARNSQDTRRTTMSVQSSAAFGTPAYMAPEQVAGEPAGKSADIYSLGVVLHEVLTGELPFGDESPLAMAVRKTRERPESPKKFAPALRTNWEQAVLRCLDPKPARRFDSVREILTSLETRSATQSRWNRTVRAVRSVVRRRRLLLGTAAVVATLAVALWLGLPRNPTPETYRDWEVGLANLHSGEPLAAIRHWDKLAGPLPVRATIDRALAWSKLGFSDRAVQELKGFRGWHGTESDREYAKAVEMLLKGDAKSAQRELLSRASRLNNDALVIADAAWLADSGLWSKVEILRPGYAAAHLQLAELAAKQNRWPEAERQFLVASSYFQASRQAEMVKTVSSRRGLLQLANGNFADAKNDLVAGAASGAGVGPCERYFVMMAGQDDNFQGPPDSVPYVSPRLQAIKGLNRLNWFDLNPELTDRDAFAVSFPLPPVRFCSGQLELRMRHSKVDGFQNDSLTVGAAPFDFLMFAPLQKTLWAELPAGENALLTIHLTAELLASIQRVYATEKVASLDILAVDDTDFDYIKITLVY